MRPVLLMRRADTLYLGVIAVLTLAVVTLGLLALVALTVQRSVPICEEDQVLVGIGHFDGERWTQYACGPSTDDYLPRNLQ